MSTKGKQGGKGEEIIYNMDGTSESAWWTRCAATGSDEDLLFCIMENSKSVLKGDKIDRSQNIVRDEQEWARTTRIENSKNVATGVS